MRHHTVAAVLLLVLAAPLAAQQYPSRPIRVVVPYPAGGVVDVVSRALTERLAANLGQPVVVENRPGGNTVVANESVLAAAPDGYTWLIAPPAFAANVSLMTLRFDPLRDFVPAARFALSADYFLLPANAPVASVAEYVRLVKSQPGKHNFGIPGIGGAAHLAFEQFKRAAGVDLTGIPYQGAPPVIPDLLNGQLSSAFIPAVITMAQAKGGKVKPIAVISQKRQKVLPDVPTIAEAGYPSVQATLWIGVVLAAKTPPEVQRRAAEEIEKAVNSPEAQARLDAVGAEAAYLGAEAFGAFIREEIEIAGRIVREAGIKIQ
jgi:tripartite-type tricarboxylate transporter receptor subunit TctC